MHDRLVELVDKAKKEYANDVTDHTETEYIVETLLDNDVIVLPCKVGQTVYKVCKRKYDVDGYGMQWVEDWGILNLPFRVDMIDQIGKTVFITIEEAKVAEAALKGSGDNV